MKKMFRKILILTVVFFGYSLITLADPPGPPSPGGSPTGSGGTPVGAPIDGGLSILLAMGAAYGGKKLYQARKEKKEAADELMSL
jgi:hypothetical protein